MLAREFRSGGTCYPLPPVETDLFAPGTAIGRYIVVDKLGEGGMGVVYRARDSQLNRLIALKVLRPREGLDAAAWQDARSRLVREAQAAAALAHGAIVTLFDVGEIEGCPFLAMEYIEGRTLREILSHPGPVSRDQAISWLRAVAEALGAAHRAGIVHRDVKPENIMVRSDGQVKVLDFGIARSTAASQARSTPQLPTLTREGAVVGTVAYMAPEQIGGEAVDGRADQFAWGVVAYELLTGRSPWTASDDPMVIISAILTKQPPHVGELVVDLPTPIGAIVTRALTKDRNGRFVSMEELLASWPVVAGAFSTGPSIAPSLPVPDRMSLGNAKTEAIPTIKMDDVQMVSGSVPVVATVPIRRRPSRWPMALAGLVVLSGVAAGTVVYRQHATAAVGSTVSSASVSPHHVPTLQDLPPPVGKPEAVAAYNEGIRACHDGVQACVKLFERAASLDPTLSAAEVRIAWFFTGSPGRQDHVRALNAYRAATSGKERLTPRDVDLMNALEPVLMHRPADWATCEQRVRALASAAPDDAELATTLGMVLLEEMKLDDASATLAHAIELDPGDAPARALQIEVHRLRGDVAGARAAANDCLERSARATACLAGLMDVESAEGECKVVQDKAHLYIQASPDDTHGYMELFASELALGSAPSTIDTTLAQLLGATVESNRARQKASSSATRAVLLGDFTTAFAYLDDRDATIVRPSDLDKHLWTDLHRAQIAAEAGEVERAGRAAEAYVERRAAIPPLGFVRSEDLAGDPVPSLLALIRDAGRLTPTVFEERREGWARRWEERMLGDGKPFVWVEAYARPAETRADAELALARVPEGVSRIVAAGQLESEAIGRVYLLAGKPEQALPLLQMAANDCEVQRSPIAITRASYLLGLAHEAKGEKAAACAAYGKVIARWGKARPRSVTARAAKEHARVLGCGPT